MEEDLKEILKAGVSAADPKEALLQSLRVEENRILADGKSFEAKRIFVLAVGKASGKMAQAVEELLGNRINGGLVVAKDKLESSLKYLETLLASHPEPDERGVEAARQVEELAKSLEEADLLLVLVSGGASALLADPAPPIGLEDLKRLTDALLSSGAEIEEINTVRKHVSVLKGGGLARLAYPARTLALLLSDVVGDDPSAIASGLTAPDSTTLEQARSVLRRYGIEPPESVAEHLEKADETPKPGDTVFEGVTNLVCGSGRQAVEAAAVKARNLGYNPLIVSTSVTGEARGVASVYAAMIREVLETGNPLPSPCAILSGGEVTVTVHGQGIGGPNQDFALALAVELEGIRDWAAFAVDTDGNDGPTDAAGGLVNGETARMARAEGIESVDALDDNDAYRALEAADALLFTGSTGTNVNDLRVALVRKPQEEK